MAPTPEENEKRLNGVLKVWEKETGDFEKTSKDLWRDWFSIEQNASSQNSNVGQLAVEACRAVQFARDLGAKGNRFEDFSDVPDVKKCLAEYDRYSKDAVLKTDKALNVLDAAATKLASGVKSLLDNIAAEIKFQDDFAKKAKIKPPAAAKKLQDLNSETREVYDSLKELCGKPATLGDHKAANKAKFEKALKDNFAKTKANKEAEEQNELLDQSFDGRKMAQLTKAAMALHGDVMGSWSMVELAQMAERPVSAADLKTAQSDGKAAYVKLQALQKAHDANVDKMNASSLGHLNGRNATKVKAAIDKMETEAKKTLTKLLAVKST